MENVTYSYRVEQLVDDIKEQLFQEFMASDDKNDPVKVKEMILNGRTLDMITATAMKLQELERKLDILLERPCKEDTAA